jgi:hypothetical protein
MEVILTILGILGFIYVAVTLSTYINILTTTKVTLVPSSDSQPPQDANKWAANNEFKFLGNYSTKNGIMPCLISVWQRPDRPTFFCQYAFRSQTKLKIAYDLVTIFANDIGLTTCSTMDGGSLPSSPGSYKQNFSNMSFDQRWNQHIEMENYLMDMGQAQLIKEDRPFEQIFTEAIRKQMKFIRSIPFWPLRGVYWHFIRRRIWRNKSIETQHERGMIKLPNELPITEL